MKKTLALFALVAVSVAVVVLTTVHGQDSNGNSSKFRRIRADKRIANQYIVVLKDDVDDVDTEAIRLARDFGGDRSGGHTYHRALKGFSVRMSEQQAARLANDPRVAFVEEDGVVSLGTTQTGATWGLDLSKIYSGPLKLIWGEQELAGGKARWEVSRLLGAQDDRAMKE